MPLTEEARIAEIEAKVKDSDETYSVPWQNRQTLLRVINLSLGSVLLNPRSHRIRAQMESHEQRGLLEDDPFSPAAQEVIEAVLAETSGFQALEDNLRESGQLDPGIITHSGVLVNANTRAVALRRLRKEYIRVGVLPESANEREMTELEARLQMARDYKQEYTLTNELLFIHEQLNAGMTHADLAILLGKAQSRNPGHIKKGEAEIEKGLRILQHVREVQELSGDAIPLVFFDPHESALTEADNAYVALRDRDPAQARRVRDGRIAGVLVGVTYRNLRNWDADDFLKDYVKPQFEDDSQISELVSGTAVLRDDFAGSAGDDGLDILDALDQPEEHEIDPSQLLAVVAKSYGLEGEAPVADGLSRHDLYGGLQERLTEAAEERAQDLRDKRRQSTPIKLVKEARQKLVRARKAFGRSTLGPEFEHGKLSYELRQVRKELDALGKANKAGA